MLRKAMGLGTRGGFCLTFGVNIFDAPGVEDGWIHTPLPGGGRKWYPHNEERILITKILEETNTALSGVGGSHLRIGK